MNLLKQTLILFFLSSLFLVSCSEAAAPTHAGFSQEILSPLGAEQTLSPSQQPPKEEKIIALTEEEEKRLKTVLSPWGDSVSLSFCDLESGYTFHYNETKSYFVASIIKAPYCAYLYSLADKGELDLAQSITYSPSFFTEGTGILKKEEPGKAYSLATLMEYSIRYSDNIAIRMLRSRFPAKGFSLWAEEAGVRNLAGVKNITNGSIHSADALIYLQKIHSYLALNNKNSEKLKQDMLHTTNPMIVSTSPVIRKYGWAEGAFHDIAIVEAEHPYAIAILSNHDEGTPADYAMFRTISKAVEEALATLDRGEE